MVGQDSGCRHRVLTSTPSSSSVYWVPARPYHQTSVSVESLQSRTNILQNTCPYPGVILTFVCKKFNRNSWVPEVFKLNCYRLWNIMFSSAPPLLAQHNNVTETAMQLLCQEPSSRCDRRLIHSSAGTQLNMTHLLWLCLQRLYKVLKIKKSSFVSSYCQLPM